MDDFKKLDDAINVIAEIGKKSYKKEYQEEASLWGKLACGFSKHTNNVSGFLEMTYKFLEDWNRHTPNFILSFVFPEILGDSDGAYHKNNMKKLERLSRTVEVKGFDEKNHYGILGKAKVTVSVEFLD